MALEDITIEEYREKFEGKDNTVLIDVREPDEYEEVRLPDTIHIPLGEVQERVAEIPTDKDVVLVCRSGGRSQMAGQFLEASGYDTVYNLLEGTLGWVRRELPTDAG